MNKNLLMIGGVVIVLLALGAGAFFILPKMKQSDVNEEGMMKETTNTEANKSIRDLMASTANQMCTYSDDMGNRGTLYSGAGKVRVDSEANTDGKILVGHMISDTQNIYIWSDDSTGGMKMAYADMQKYENGNTNTQNQNVNLDEQVDYQCDPWSVDSSKFELPSNVTFNDFSAMMKDAMSSMPEASAMPDPSSQCAACENLPEEAATQCRAALNCN